jgi:hypothetical protein
MSACSPASSPRKVPALGASCLTDSDIRHIARRVKVADLKVAKLTDTTRLAATLRRVLGDDETDWLNNRVIREDAQLHRKLSSRFKPKRPHAWRAKPRTWLSTIDIERVMQQYDSQEFKFLGVFPRDFADAGPRHRCLATRDVCAPPLRKLAAAGVRGLGIVFNLDRHSQRGSHWVACFVSLDPDGPMYGAYYYDSVARPPPPEIAEWIVKLQDSMDRGRHRERQNKRFEIAYNRERRQFEDAECGIFAIAFLTSALRNDRSFSDVCKRMGDDDDMHALRNVFYRV